jgi:geranylgeranyl diphosphate synthase type II
MKEELIKIVDNRLKKYLALEGKLGQAMRYSVFAGGKRFRPLLCFAAAQALGKNPKKVLPIACAIEMLHVFTLIHDDLPAMDNSSLRRGKKTNHVKFNEAIAILAGDALNTMAFQVLAKEKCKLKVIEEISKALVKVCHGQVMDLGSINKELKYHNLLHIHENKTAALIVACVMSVALELGANQQQIKALARFARHLGLAFQIADDILDVESTAQALGKPVRADKLKGFPFFLGLEKARQFALKEKKLAIKALKPFGSKARELVALAEFVVNRKN